MLIGYKASDEHRMGPNNAPKKILDVIPPGKTPPSATSRDLIPDGQPAVTDNTLLVTNTLSVAESDQNIAVHPAPPLEPNVASEVVATKAPLPPKKKTKLFLAVAAALLLVGIGIALLQR